MKIKKIVLLFAVIVLGVIIAWDVISVYIDTEGLPPEDAIEQFFEGTEQENREYEYIVEGNFLVAWIENSGFYIGYMQENGGFAFNINKPLKLKNATAILNGHSCHMTIYATQDEILFDLAAFGTVTSPLGAHHFEDSTGIPFNKLGDRYYKEITELLDGYAINIIIDDTTYQLWDSSEIADIISSPKLYFSKDIPD